MKCAIIRIRRYILSYQKDRIRRGLWVFAQGWWEKAQSAQQIPSCYSDCFYYSVIKIKVVSDGVEEDGDENNQLQEEGDEALLWSERPGWKGHLDRAKPCLLKGGIVSG